MIRVILTSFMSIPWRNWSLIQKLRCGFVKLSAYETLINKTILNLLKICLVMVQWKSKTKSINNILTVVWGFAFKIHPCNYTVTPHSTQIHTHTHTHTHTDIYMNYYFVTTVFQFWIIIITHYPLDTEFKLNLHKSFRRPEGFLIVICPFNLRPMSRGYYYPTIFD